CSTTPEPAIRPSASSAVCPARNASRPEVTDTTCEKPDGLPSSAGLIRSMATLLRITRRQLGATRAAGRGNHGHGPGHPRRWPGNHGHWPGPSPAPAGDTRGSWPGYPRLRPGLPMATGRAAAATGQGPPALYRVIDGRINNDIA